MAYVPLTAAEVDADSPIDAAFQTKLKDNFDEHETRLGLIESGSHNDIRDDFAGEIGATGIDLVQWVAPAPAGGTTDIVSAHRLSLLSNNGGASFAAIYGQPEKIRVDTDDVYTVVLEFRIMGVGNVDSWYTVGLQDAALVTRNAVVDLTDMIGLTGDIANNSWEYRVDAGGAGPTLSADVATFTDWHVFKFTVTCGASPSILLEIDGVPEVAVTTNVPSIPLRPSFGCAGDGAGANRRLYIDYVICAFQARPVSP